MQQQQSYVPYSGFACEYRYDTMARIYIFLNIFYFSEFNDYASDGECIVSNVIIQLMVYCMSDIYPL